MTTLSTESDLVEWCYALDFFARLVAYVAVLAVLVLIVLIILKYVTDFGEESTGDEDLPVTGRAATVTVTETETHLLFSEKARLLTDGTCEEEEGEDIERGSCSSSEELYDGRMCVICYDEQRNCFLVPCGHCATCYDCAQRIYEGENKMNGVKPRTKKKAGESLRMDGDNHCKAPTMDGHHTTYWNILLRLFSTSS
ncbi:Zinc finger, RING/FYVE/PHD-type [Corchorus capsularis]|uniref:Zinc finger, RING/FYVE/PHD-type n=1 Tax=Corchorus capsularis TaxID=210143 RepID=A0A1R3GEV3_COCAP|nr:Zinc finger, RING/FYVE/PHD-type [Corchorus capsularis]